MEGAASSAGSYVQLWCCGIRIHKNFRSTILYNNANVSAEAGALCCNKLGRVFTAFNEAISW